MGKTRAKEFFENLDRPAIAEAIRKVESRSYGEVHVHLHHGPVADAKAAAERTFHKLGMAKTIRGSACLIFLAPESRKFAIIGGAGIHEKVGDGFWLEARDAARARFAEEKFTEGIIAAVEKIGDALALVFPRHGTPDRNELPDDVSED